MLVGGFGIFLYRNILCSDLLCSVGDECLGCECSVSRLMLVRMFVWWLFVGYFICF